MSKKRIAIFGVKYFPSRGGTSRVVENLLYQLKDHFEFTIYCYKHEEALTHIPGVKVVQFPEIPIKGIGVFIYYFICCFHIMLRGSYDLVHLHKTDGAFFLPVLGLKYKTIATSHALPYMNDKWSGIGKAYFRWVERIFMRSNATLSSISRPQVEYYTKLYNREVNFIPNGVEPLEEIYPELATEFLAKHHQNSPFILFAARRVIPLKGGHTMIDALQKIQYKGTLIIAGDTEQVPNYTKELKTKAKGLDVKFVGYVNNRDLLNALIHQAELFVFPSEIEGMSMMLLEVGSVGTPMVCSDIPQNKAVLSDEEVLYFKSKDVSDLAEKLSWAFQNPNEMKLLANKTQETVEQDYLVSKVVGQYIELYQSVLYPDQTPNPA